jgi:hypothetical protein
MAAAADAFGMVWQPGHVPLLTPGR